MDFSQEVQQTVQKKTEEGLLEVRGPGLPCSNLRRLVGEEDYDDDWIHFFARRLQFLYFSRESFLPLSLKNDAEQSQNNQDNFPSNTNAFTKVNCGAVSRRRCSHEGRRSLLEAAGKLRLYRNATCRHCNRGWEDTSASA
ncbi:Calcineurin-Binding Protein Cabin-1 [Manis pentadactyla]|nr:Calcineurin-Binding Protein Cabin-1 [Manis pentadactyla]